jgi:hypothetical protein
MDEQVQTSQTLVAAVAVQALTEDDIKIARTEFLDQIPGQCVNEQSLAPSTKECKDDLWGKDPRHYRWVNVKDSQGNPIQLDGKPGKFQKELRLIGRGHIEWDRCYVLVRVSPEEAKWYKHWPVAAHLYLNGQLPESEIDWFVQEGVKRWEEGELDGQISGELTAGVRALMKAKIVGFINGKVQLR